MTSYIIDTNVWKAASEESECTPQCMDVCRQFLSKFSEMSTTDLLVMDQLGTYEEVPGNSVFQELKANLQENTYAHDLFWKVVCANWMFDLVEISYDHEGALLPKNLQINQRFSNGSTQPFEPNDRKWIALYLQRPQQPIYNAHDGDWDNAKADLTTNRIQVRQLCTGHDI